MVTISVIGGPLYQWDTDRKVKIELPDGIGVGRVDFYTRRCVEPLPVKTYIEDNDIVANIPNILLQDSLKITAYVVICPGKGERTISERRIEVTSKPKPPNYVYTETEVLCYEHLEERIVKLETERTHYVESVTEPVELVNEVLEFDEELGYYPIKTPFSLPLNKTVIVNVDGTDYECTSFVLDTNSVIITNGTLTDDGMLPPESGEFFVVQQIITNDAYNGLVTETVFVSSRMENEDFSPVNLTISNKGHEIIKKLDNKYLDLDWLPVFKKKNEVYNKDVNVTFEYGKFECLGGYASYRDTESKFDDVFEVGKQYVVKIGEETFTTTCKTHTLSYESTTLTYLGNLALFTPDKDLKNTGEPYCIVAYFGVTILYGFADQTVNVQIFEADVNKMPEEYLPETVASKEFVEEKFKDIPSGGGGSVSAEQIQSAVNNALEQAKESGEFDGADGKTAYQYAKDGGYTGTEEEFAHKLAEEISGVEITGGEPTKESTVLTVNPNAEEVNLCTEEDFNALREEINTMFGSYATDVANLIGGIE